MAAFILGVWQIQHGNCAAAVGKTQAVAYYSIPFSEFADALVVVVSHLLSNKHGEDLRGFFFDTRARFIATSAYGCLVIAVLDSVLIDLYFMSV